MFILSWAGILSYRPVGRESIRAALVLSIVFSMLLGSVASATVRTWHVPVIRSQTRKICDPMYRRQGQDP